MFAQMAAERFRAQYAAETLRSLAGSTPEQLAEALDAALAQYTDAQCAAYYDEVLEFSDSTLERNLISLGRADLDSPATVNLYASTFAGKDAIKEAIDRYNETADELQESARNHRTWEDWKRFIAEYREKLRKSRSVREKDDRDAVTVSTLHAAKGMEYDAVYILDVNEGIIPWRKAVLDEDLEEERRMLYVGMTRARKRLRLYAVRERYEKPVELSRFIKDMI